MSEIDLEALADRVEKLAGPCRETDAEIALALGIVKERDGNCFYGHRDYSVMVMERSYYDHEGNAPELPSFSASIDAAMSLVPEGWRWELRNWPVSAQMEAPDYNPDIYHGYSEETLAATPAIALVVACLRARASLSRLSPPPTEVKQL